MKPIDILNRFTAKEGDKNYPKYANPWLETLEYKGVWVRWAFATDGRILVRIPDPGDVTLPYNKMSIFLSGTKLMQDEQCFKRPAHRVPRFRIRRVDLVRIGIQMFDPKYLRMIADLPGVRLYNSVKRIGAATFKFKGGEGRLMPCLPPTR